MSSLDIKKIIRPMIKDPSFWAIILGNVFTIILALSQNWPMGQILWVYWSQSVIIGAVNTYRIASLKDFSTKGLSQNGKAVPETHSAKMGIAVFFSIHYGFFHLVYAIFLSLELPLTQLNFSEIVYLLMVALGFIGSHGFSYRYNLNKDFKHKRPNLGTIMFYPYLRIIPMHLTIILGSFMFSAGSLILFMAIKTIADSGMHAVEHYLFRHKKGH